MPGRAGPRHGDRMNIEQTLTVRPAGVRDVATLTDLGARTFLETYADQIPFGPLSEVIAETFNIERQHAEVADPDCMVLIAEAGDHAAGYLVAHPTTPPNGPAAATMSISRLYVDAPIHGRGVGSALLDSALTLARRDGHEYLWLTVWEHNLRARDAYAAWGFEDLGPIPFQFAGLQQTDRLMVRSTLRRSAAA